MAVTRRQIIGGALAVPITIAAGIQASRSGIASGARNSLTLLVGAAPGGGWDTVAREMQEAMRARGIVANPQVINVPGAAGTIALEQLVQMVSRNDVIMITGTVMLGGIEVNDSTSDLTQTTPIAHLADDYEAFVVPADSPFTSLRELVEAMRDDPGGIAIGGGSLGGTDHLLAAMLARDENIPPGEINYVAFAGGGEAVSALLSNSIAVGVSGYNEFADQVTAGNLRLLAICAPEPLPDIDGPTMAEEGFDTYLPNWRGAVAPAGITPEERTELTAIVRETVETPEWRDALERNRWIDAYEDGSDFADFVGSDTRRISDIIKELGL